MVRLSPEITPTKYKRSDDESLENDEIERYTFDRTMVPNADSNPRCVVTSDGMVRYIGEVMDVFCHGGHVHVPESAYRTHGMVLIREYVLSVLVTLSDDGIIVGLRKTDDATMR